ncbi:hypothetical protein GCM10023235_07710 [Kitasatospora terrestris]|uniref:Uncharacterized protein n=2 Tax=Kitasatospora terrestris TaxID=258051 RepID=A0ABP9DDY3_9ACTN
MAGLGGFPPHYRVSVVVAWVLCGLSVLCLVSTWLPEPYVAPRWLVFALFLAVAPVFAMAFLLPSVEGLTEVGHRDASALLPWIGLVPGRVRAVHDALVLLAFVGFVSGAASADDVFADAHGYHRRYKDRTAHPHLVVDITEAEYEAATVGELRLFSAGPIAFASGDVRPGEDSRRRWSAAFLFRRTMERRNMPPWASWVGWSVPSWAKQRRAEPRGGMQAISTLFAAARVPTRWHRLVIRCGEWLSHRTGESVARRTSSWKDRRDRPAAARPVGA